VGLRIGVGRRSRPRQTGDVAEPGAQPGDEPIVEASAASAGTMSSHARPGAVFDWVFRSRRTGRITVAQFPNVALWIFLATVGLRWVVPIGTWVRTAVDWITALSLAWWAIDEVLRGVNPWRRFLGLVVGALVVTGAVSMLR